MLRTVLIGIASLLSAAWLTGCQKNVKADIDLKGDVHIHFNPVVKSSALEFTNTYLNDFGEAYTVKTFRFYIHSIQLVGINDDTRTITDEYYLVDAANTASRSLALKALAGRYKSIAFTIGVDSIRNVSGAQTNALDPANGMFWTWNSGYIMARFEGSSPVSNQPGNRFEFHIGGFKGDENVVKRIELPFPAASTLDVGKGKSSVININADANAWFNSVTHLDIATYPVCITPGPLAKSFAENYYHMFRVTDIETN